MELRHARLEKSKRVLLRRNIVQTVVTILRPFSAPFLLFYLAYRTFCRRVEAEVDFSQSGREAVAAMNGIFGAVRSVQSPSLSQGMGRVFEPLGSSVGLSSSIPWYLH